MIHEQITPQQASDLAQSIDRLNDTLRNLFGAHLPGQQRLPEALAYRWHRSRDIFARSQLIPIDSPQLMSFSSLRNIDRHIIKLRQNTAQFANGLPANNVLMTGARGTGKSSLVRCCLDEFHSVGLRIIEVEKQYLDDLPDIVSLIKGRDEKYLIFCDDLSFEDGEHGYKGLKTVLDGSTAGPSPNVLIYATSNRRHMVNERSADNLERVKDSNGDMHPGDTVEEKISLSERFGLHLHFYGFTESEYLQAVAQWLSTHGFDLHSNPEIEAAALRWASTRGARSGRVAAQFARDYAGQMQSMIMK